MTIGERIRKERDVQGISRPQLAKLTGIPYPTLSGIESGDQGSTTRLHQIADALGVRPKWLETGEGPKHGVAEAIPRYSSQDVRPDFEKLGLAVHVLREYLSIRNEPAEWIIDPIMLEVAYTVVEEFSEPVAPTNLLFLTKKMAEKQRDATQPSALERTGRATSRKVD
jgi:transcriptional regulator with XRE-family HTH domain